jgi:hypothetical protein
MPRRSKQPIHSSIMTRLGYGADQNDAEVVKDWKARITRVCKPCWELKYRPYGRLVEQSPHLPIPRADVIAHNEYLRRRLREGMTGDIEPLSPRRVDINTLPDGVRSAVLVASEADRERLLTVWLQGFSMRRSLWMRFAGHSLSAPYGRGTLPNTQR